MKGKIKGVLLLVLAVIFSLCLVACDQTSESVPNSQTHECQFENWQVSVEAGCETDGEEIATCSCGETSTRVVPAIGHSFGEWTGVSESTCSVKGKEKAVCGTCGKEQERELPLLEHSFVAMEIEPTCQAEGRSYEKCSVCYAETDGTAIPKLAHDLVEEVSGRTLRSSETCENKATYWKTCSACGEISSDEYFSYGETVDHRLKNAFACAVNLCLDCESEFPATSEHSFGEWIEVGASSCSATAVNFHACQDCGYAEDEHGLQNAVSHHDITFTETKATCDKEGSFVVSCSNCDFETVVTYRALGHVYKWQVDENGHKQVCLRDNCDSVVNQGAHRSSNSATCTEDEVCVVCNYLILARLNHSWVSIPDKAPTCEEDGYKNAKQCQNCQQIVKITVKGGHDFTFVSGKQATCEENGTVAHNHCETCQKDYDLQGNYLSSVVVDSLGHDYSNAWSYDENGHYKECSRCDVKKDAGSHISSGSATETTAEVCTTCGYVINPKLGHTHSYQTEQIEPTCTKEGYTLHTCSGCGHTKKTDFVAKSEHSYENETLKQELSCETDEIFQKECSVCHKVVVRVARTATGHDESGWETQTEPTCTQNGVAYKRCQRQGCGKVLDEKVLEKKGHSYKENQRQNATCTEDGFVVYKCENCSDSHRVTLSKLGHDESGWIVDQDATCEDDGTKHTVCQRQGCGVTISTGVISAKGHIEQWRVETDATCEDDGLKIKYCTREDCGERLGQETISALGHIEGGWIVDENATCTDNGTKHTVCQREDCGETVSTGIIEALGHDEGGWIVDENATCSENGTKHTVCQREDCGETVSTGIIEALGHDEGWRVETSATCEENGLKIKYCTREYCGEQLGEEVILSLGHNGEWTVEKNATCEEDGLQVEYCTRENCGIELNRETISALGHNGEWTVEKNATCEEDGLKVEYCTRENCKERLNEEVILATGHDDGEWQTESQPTCSEDGLNAVKCGKCGSVLNTETISALGHDFSGNLVYDDHYHYNECLNRCGEKDGYCPHSYSQTLHEEVEDKGDQKVYTAYIEFSCECGYSFNSESVTNSVHQSIVAIEPIAPTCVDVGYTVGLKCGVDGCDEIFLQPTEISELGHDVVNGVCLRCGEKEEVSRITLLVKMEFANGVVWEEYDQTSSGHTVYSYFATWDMWDEEVADIYYFEINDNQRPLEDLYTYVLVDGDKIFVKFSTVTAEDTPTTSKCVYVVAIGNTESGNQTNVVYFADASITVDNFFALAGIDSAKVLSISVNGEKIDDYNQLLGQAVQMVINYSEDFTVKNFATIESYSKDQNGELQLKQTFYASTDIATFTLNDLAIVFGYSNGEDLISKIKVTVNGESVNADYLVQKGDLIYLINEESQVTPSKEVEVNYNFIFADGITQSGTYLAEKGSDVYELIDGFCDGAFWATMLVYDVKTATYNGEEIDVATFLFEEEGSLTIEFATFKSEVETISVNVSFNYGDGSSESNQTEFIKGATLESFIKWICSYDSWQAIYDDIDSVRCEDAYYGKDEFVFENSCSITINFKSFTPPEDTSIYVTYMVYDLDGIEVASGEMSTDLTNLYDVINNLGLTNAALENVKSVVVNGEEVADYQNYELDGDCVLEIYLDVSLGESSKNVVTIVSYDANGNPTGSEMSFEIDGDQITLRNLIELNTPFSYEEFIESEKGNFYRDGEPLSAESVIYVNTKIEFRYDEYVAPEKIEIYFDSSFYSGYISIPEGCSIGNLFENILSHPFVYTTFSQFVEHGDVHVDGAIVYSSDYQLKGGETVRYDHRDNQCDGHVWNSDGFCSNCGTECPHNEMQDGNACPQCGYFPTYYREYKIVLLMGDYVENDPFYEYGCQETWVKVEATALKDFTLSLILQSDGGWVQEKIEQAQACGYYYVWTVNGNLASESDVIDEYVTIIGVLSRVTVEPFEVTVFNEDYGEQVYEYSYPVCLEVVFGRYLGDTGLSLEYFYAKMEQGFEYDVITADCSVECVEEVNYVRYQVVSLNGESEWKTMLHKATKTPTIEQVFENLGLSTSEYSAYRYGRKIESLDEQAGDNLVIFENAVFSDEFIVTINYKQFFDSEIITYTVTVDCPASVEVIINEKLREANPDAEISIDPYYYAIRVGEFLLGSGENDGYFDYANHLLYSDCVISVTQAYRYYLSCENVSVDKSDIRSDKALSGEEILQMANVSDDWSSLIIFVNDTRYSLEEFKSTVFSDEDKGETHISIRKGMVYVNVEIIDENEYGYVTNCESYEEIDLNYFGIAGSFSDYEILVTLPSGEIVTLTDYDYKFKFNSEFAVEYGYQNYRTEYSVKFTAKSFRVSLYVDSTWQGEQFFEKGNSYTLSEILSQFGDYEIDNYNWNIRTHNGEWLDSSSPIERSVEIEAYDIRPRIFLSVESQEYVIYHTEETTLAMLLELVKGEYGVEIKYEDYCWDYELDGVVASSQETIYVYARILTQVKVLFYSEYGWVENSYDEYGNMGTIYQKDSEWSYPTVDLGSCYGLMLFDGKWEYRSEIMTKTVTSVQDLFAIGKEEIELWAVCELDYERLMGTYFVEDRKVIVIGENNSITYNDPWDIEFTSTFNVVQNGMSFALEVSDWGYTIDAMWLQDYYKVSQDAFISLVLDPFGNWNTFTSYADYLSYVESFEVSEIKNVYGEYLEEVGQSGIYFVYLLEKPYEE